VEVLILGSAAVGVAAAAVVLVIAAVPAGKTVFVLVSSGQRFLLPWVGLLFSDVRLTVRLREKWSLAYRVWAGMVWFKALLALD